MIVDFQVIKIGECVVGHMYRTNTGSNYSGYSHFHPSANSNPFRGPSMQNVRDSVINDARRHVVRVREEAARLEELLRNFEPLIEAMPIIDESS